MLSPSKTMRAARISAAVLSAEILVALGFLGSLAPLLYLVALLWFLFLATRCFVWLMFPVARAEPPAD